MTDDRRPLSMRAKLAALLGAIVVIGLVAALALAVIDRRRKHAATLSVLARFTGLARSFSQSGGTGGGRATLLYSEKSQIGGEFHASVVDPERVRPDEQRWILRDAWDRPLVFRAPGPVHTKGWDLYSVGPDGIDDDGAGDDIVVGEDATPR